MADESLGWHWGFLTDLAIINPARGEAESLPATFHYVDLSSLSAGGIADIAELEIYAKNDAPSRAQRQLRECDSLVATVRPERGARGLVGAELNNQVGSTGLCVLRPIRKADARFLYSVIRQDEFTEWCVANSSGTSYPAVSQHAIGRFPLFLPPARERALIGAVLGALDDKIESNRRIVKQVELLLLVHSISSSTLPTVALRDVSKSYRRPVNPLVLGDEWVDHFSLPAFDAAAMPERCQASSIMSGKFGIETTSVLISRLNPGTPRVWCAHVREVPAMCSSEFLVLEPLKKSSVGALWLAAVHPSLGEQMVQRATGTSFSHQRIKSDDALSVEVPDIRMIDEQTRSECDELVKMVGKRRGETEHLSRLRDVLLPELLSGRLRVKNAESMMENV